MKNIGIIEGAIMNMGLGLFMNGVSLILDNPKIRLAGGFIHNSRRHSDKT